MKFRSVFLIGALFLCFLPVWGQTWNLSSTMTAVLNGEGLLTIATTADAEAMPNYDSNSNPPWYNYRSNILSIRIGEGVTGIGSFAFYQCGRITSLTIPNYVTSIGSYAFSGCSGLKSVVLEDGTATLSFGDSSAYEKAFENCPIESLYMGRNINSSPFSEKTTLKSLTIGSSVTSIGQYAFGNCSGLTGTLIIPNPSCSQFI